MEEARNIKLTIEYDGTNYHGWQSQKNAVAIQDVIENTITKLTGSGCSLCGCSRTDAGVHAYGQVANFHTFSTIPGDKFSYALNGLLPEDIIVVNSEEVDTRFHARYSAKGKKYKYIIYNSPFPSALLRNRACFVSTPLNFENMLKAAEFFQGKHDFSAFRAAGSSTETTVRTIFDLELAQRDSIIEMDISGDGFLYNMVRIIAGTLIYVGHGKLVPEDMEGIIESRKRGRAGKTAPAQGLYLSKVFY